MTKKQLKAISDIYSWSEAGRVPANKWGLLRNEHGFCIQCGMMAVLFPGSPDSGITIPTAQSPQDEDILTLVTSEMTNGDYRIVTEPFSGFTSSGKIATLLKEHSISYRGSAIGGRVEIHSENTVARFDPLFVRLAVEAIGGKVRLYLGKTSRWGSPLPMLLITTEDKPFDLEHGTFAVVMPVRN